jgi:hypothetical protein
MDLIFQRKLQVLIDLELFYFGSTKDTKKH